MRGAVAARMATVVALAAASVLVGVTTPAGAASPPATAAPAGTLDGRSRLTVDLPDDAQAPGSVTVTVSGADQAAQVVPMLSDRTAMVVVVDASDGGAPQLQPGLSGVANLVLTVPPRARSALVADTDPPVVVAPLAVGPSGALRGLSVVHPQGARQTAAALDLALQQFPPGPDDPRLVVLYTDRDGRGRAPCRRPRCPVGGSWRRPGRGLTGARGAAVLGRGHRRDRWRGGPGPLGGHRGVRRAGSHPANLLSGDLPQARGVARHGGRALRHPAGPGHGRCRRGPTGRRGGFDRGLVRRSGLDGRCHRPDRARGGGAGVDRGPESPATGRHGPDGRGVERPRPRRGTPRPATGCWRRCAPRCGTAGSRCCVPTAMAGLGATSAMIQFVDRWRDDYDIAWWVPAADPPLVADRLAELGETLGLAVPTDSAEEATDRVLAALRRRGRWLLVLDDAGSRRQLARFLPGGPGHVLVASDDPAWDGHATAVAVGRFDRDESVAVLRSRCPALPAVEADRVAAALDDVPHAVDVAGATLAETGMTVETFLRTAHRARCGRRGSGRSSVQHRPRPARRRRPGRVEPGGDAGLAGP